MKLEEFIKRTLDEDDEFIVEMANFLADVTELPANIVLWTRPQPAALPHDKYRIKVYKDRIHVATFLIAQTPLLMWKINAKKLQLDDYETKQTVDVIGKFSSLFIQYVDATMTAVDVKCQIKKLHGEEE